jgi:NNP family nitrate/nitrite transporter-like MFS transporter
VAREDEGTSSFRSVVPALFFLAAIFFLNFTSRILFSPLLPLISDELGMSHADSGSFFLCISFGYFVSILLSGYVSCRLNHKRTIFLSSLSSGVMLLVLSGCTSLVGLRLGLVGLGLAAGLYLPSGFITIVRLVPIAYIARGMAVHELAPNISFVVAPILCAAGLLVMNWRVELGVCGAMLIGTSVLFLKYGNASLEKGTAPSSTKLKQILRLPTFWLITTMFSMAICSTLGIYAMLPLYLVSGLGMDFDSANTLLAFSRIGSVVMPILGGWFGDRYGNLKVMGIVLFMAGVLTIPLGCTDGALLVLLAVVQPMVAVCFFPSAFAVLADIGPGSEKNVAVSICIPLAFLFGGGILPTVIGTIGDRYNLGVGIIASGCLMVFASFCAVFLLKKTHVQRF